MQSVRKTVKKRTLIIILAALCLLCCLTFFGCGETVTYQDIIFFVDGPNLMGDIVITLRRDGFSDIEIEPVRNQTEYEYPNVPSGKWEATRVMFGVTDTFTVDIKAGDLSSNLRMFDDSVEVGGEIIHNIRTRAQLQRIAAFSGIERTLNYRLVGDIDMANSYANLGVFTGNFDGRGFAVRNLRQTAATAEKVGLTAENRGTIQNLRLQGFNLTGERHVGAVAGINYGRIWDVTVQNGAFSGNNFVGGVAGADLGDISGCTVAATTVTSTGYFGLIAGLSYTNIFFDSYGVIPTQTAAAPITGAMTPLQKLTTAVENWIALPDRAKTVHGEARLDLNRLVEAAVASTRGLFDTLVQMVINGVVGYYNLTVDLYLEGKIVYNGAVETNDSGEVFAVGGGYISATPIEQAITDFAELLGPMGFDLGFDIVEYALGGAIYYNYEDDLLEFTESSSSTVGKDKQVNSLFDRRVFQFRLFEDIAHFIGNDGNVTYEDVYNGFFQDTIRLIQEYAYYGVIDGIIADIAGVNPVLVAGSDKFENGIYTMSFEIDAQAALQPILDSVNEVIGWAEYLAGLEYPQFAVGVGNRVNIDFKGEKLILKAEIYENGFIKSISIDGLDMDIGLSLADEAKQTLRDLARTELGLTNIDPLLNNLVVSILIISPIEQRFLYGERDLDINLYRTFLTGERVDIVEYMGDPHREPMLDLPDLSVILG